MSLASRDLASGNTSRDTYGSKGSATIFVFGL